MRIAVLIEGELVLSGQVELDGGSLEIDAGPHDAGMPPPDDAGSIPSDAGASDGGADAGPPTIGNTRAKATETMPNKSLAVSTRSTGQAVGDPARATLRSRLAIMPAGLKRLTLRAIAAAIGPTTRSSADRVNSSWCRSTVVALCRWREASFLEPPDRAHHMTGIAVATRAAPARTSRSEPDGNSVIAEVT